jgi:hypothetical protein
MNARTLDLPQSDDTGFQFPRPTEKSRARVRWHHDFRAHSSANIDAWKGYLPDDCVAAMIKMGWDRTT